MKESGIAAGYCAGSRRVPHPPTAGQTKSGWKSWDSRKEKPRWEQGGVRKLLQQRGRQLLRWQHGGLDKLSNIFSFSGFQRWVQILCSHTPTIQILLRSSSPMSLVSVLQIISSQLEVLNYYYETKPFSQWRIGTFDSCMTKHYKKNKRCDQKVVTFYWCSIFSGQFLHHCREGTRLLGVTGKGIFKPFVMQSTAIMLELI